MVLLRAVCNRVVRLHGSTAGGVFTVWLDCMALLRAVCTLCESTVRLYCGRRVHCVILLGGSTAGGVYLCASSAWLYSGRRDLCLARLRGSTTGGAFTVRFYGALIPVRTQGF